jgi:NAD(P)-dependent dehydrogenase (short-subunit alcohol dehydrogenase family)
MNDPQTIVFTGATTGLGKVAALKALSEGHHLLILSRNSEKSSELINDFKKEYPAKEANAVFIDCDLTSFKSIKTAIEEIKTKVSQIDMLVNNAGMWNTDFNETEDGFEETFQVNLLAPVYLLEGLMPLLKASDKAKYIVTSSGLHQGSINFEDIEYRAKWSGFNAYRQSKLGVILMCRLFAKSHPEITFCAQHPGVVRTNLGHKFGWLSRAIFYLIGKSAKKGARTLIHLIESSKSELVSGEYYAKSKVTPITKESNDMQMAEKLKKVIDDNLAKLSY